MYYVVLAEKSVFTVAEKYQLTLSAIREYLIGDKLDAVITTLWCM